ncbi:MAG: UDP-N-acetylmuramate--L-alanine ligase [Alphaproteobacteria bacterium]
MLSDFQNPTDSSVRDIPINVGTFHFVGIGGIGMSGIAEILFNLGYQVQGSDMSANANVKRLMKLGIKVLVGHEASNVDEANVLVVSSAIKADNPELIAARQKFLPIVRRAEMLGELMRLKWSIAVGGTHGKTTTTSMVAAMLDGGGLQPTVINGGIINHMGTNAWLGEGKWLVAEADESDGTFTKLPSTIAIVTNIDPEHMEHYKTVENLHASFDQFVENVPFYGFAVVCIDDPSVQAMIARIKDKRLLTYGFSPQAEVRGENLRMSPDGSTFDLVFTKRDGSAAEEFKDLFIGMVGQHNVSNALASVAIALELGFDEAKIRAGLSGFSGVKRRFTKTGEAHGITVIDDYGHHPVEISAVLQAARAANAEGKVIAVVQPHRYSRLKDLFDDFCTCFNDADHVLVADVFTAGEEQIEDYGKEKLANGLTSYGHRSSQVLESPDVLAQEISKLASAGDMVVCLGAGSISAWANDLPEQLEAIL